MNNSVDKPSLLQNILQRTGGWYIIIAIFITQLISSFGTIAINYSIQTNAEFTRNQLVSLSKFIAATFLITNFLALAVAYFLYGDVRKRLDLWKRGQKNTSTVHDDIRVWNQITSFAWRYSIFLFVANLLITVIPEAIFQIFTLDVHIDQVIYTLLGNFALILSSTVLSLLLLDYFLKPTYAVLLPKNHGKRHIRAKGAGISVKLQGTTLALILISILLVAPIGYHQTAQALALETNDPAVLQAMQTQSLIVTFLTILFGILLSTLFARSVSSPLQQLIQTFNEIEAGDLKQRAKITAPDELGELAIYFNSMVSRLDELQSSLETQINLRTEQLKATSEVGRVVSSILDPDELIEEVVNLITERLGYYYAAIFLISPDGAWAELRGATGEAGQELRSRKHRLSLSGKSMVGSAINLREARIAHDVGQEAVRFDNPLLPHTRSEIALPLVVGGHILGALDAQSTEENAFDEDITETLQGMANQVAVALENAHLFQETQEALREVRANQRTQLSKAWSETLDAQGNLEFSTGEKTASEKSVINIPLALRDQIIGDITLERQSDWTAEEEGWVEAVATQAALALENARLLEESQQVALQERLVAEITSKIWSSNTTDGILKTAIKELGSALGANEAIIELKIDESLGSSMESKSHGA